MNPFFDISQSENLSDEDLQLHNLGSQRIMASIGTPSRNEWGERSFQTSNFYTPTVAEDYDNLFVYKLNKWKPVYAIEQVVNHHYQFYIKTNPSGHDNFMKHMRYVILPIMKRQKSTDASIELFEEWLDTRAPKKQTKGSGAVNNTISIGNVNAPLQFQQSSDHAVQTQHNHYLQGQIIEAFELLKKDMSNIDAQIRADFAIEMTYAVTQLEKNKDVRPQLLNIGGLIKDVGIGTFTNLLAAPIFEIIKPLLGL